MTAKPVLGNLALFEPVVAGTMVFLVYLEWKYRVFFPPGVDSSFFFWKNFY